MSSSNSLYFFLLQAHLGHSACSWTNVGVEELGLSWSKGSICVCQDLNKLFISMTRGRSRAPTGIPPPQTARQSWVRSVL